ncbi:hypothetical protein CDAR_369761 [Caerostris darwini]|uniref:Uncharacterized protein n=1 Tax=Caerostris darwini TaxID=1538125 RepID=A0AAV4QZK0_9ARAC|nr:hypothetical protein CDAR_369741 [Caerostris darwini]GIY14251.1 hypothetical protein CDAR_369761 [Caerostris darwini]
MRCCITETAELKHIKLESAACSKFFKCTKRKCGAALLTIGQLKHTKLESRACSKFFKCIKREEVPWNKMSPSLEKPPYLLRNQPPYTPH